MLRSRARAEPFVNLQQPQTYNVSLYDFQGEPLRLTGHLASRLSTSGVTSSDVAALVNMANGNTICTSFMCGLSLNPYKSIAQSLCDLSLISTSFNRVVEYNIATLKATKSQ